MTGWIRLTTGLILVATVAAWSASASLARSHSDVVRPSVRVTDWRPLVLVGRQFRPFERVVIRIVRTGSPTVVKRLRATRRGTFVATLATSIVDRCSGLSVSVTGAGGRVAKLRLPLPLCPPGIP
jgi:hypothetical protein